MVKMNLMSKSLETQKELFKDLVAGNRLTFIEVQRLKGFYSDMVNVYQENVSDSDIRESQS